MGIQIRIMGLGGILLYMYTYGYVALVLVVISAWDGTYNVGNVFTSPNSTLLCCIINVIVHYRMNTSRSSDHFLKSDSVLKLHPLYAVALSTNLLGMTCVYVQVLV